MPKPHSCAVDMATIVHSVTPHARGKRDRSGRPLNTWRGYADNVVQRLLWTLCSRQGNIEGEVRRPVHPRRGVAESFSLLGGMYGGEVGVGPNLEKVARRILGEGVARLGITI